MRQNYIFHTEDYYNTLKNQIGSGIPVFHGVRQRGGGIGSILGSIGKYALPLVLKYIYPSARKAATSLVSDIVQKRSNFKDSLKASGKELLQGIGSSILKEQSGEGIIIRGTKRKLPQVPVRTKKPRAAEKSKRRKKNIIRRTKLDIFD
jgi:hypothetical protein